MSEDEALDRLRAIMERYKGEYDCRHVDADELLCEVLRSLGYNELVDLYESFEKWYT